MVDLQIVKRRGDEQTPITFVMQKRFPEDE